MKIQSLKRYIYKQDDSKKDTFIRILQIYSDPKEKKNQKKYRAIVWQALGNSDFNEWVKDNWTKHELLELGSIWTDYNEALQKVAFKPVKYIRKTHDDDMKTVQLNTENPNKFISDHITKQHLTTRYSIQFDLSEAIGENASKPKIVNERLKHLIKRNFLDQITTHIAKNSGKLNTYNLEQMLNKGVEEVNIWLQTYKIQPITKEKYKEELLSGRSSKMKALIQKIDTTGEWIKPPKVEEKTSTAEHAATSWWNPVKR